jgi:hypothetical protein
MPDKRGGFGDLIVRIIVTVSQEERSALEKNNSLLQILFRKQPAVATAAADVNVSPLVS